MATDLARKTNERPGTRAVLRYCRMSSFKAREVLDLVRGMEYSRAIEILDHTERSAATVIAKLLRSAAANAEHNDGLDPTDLYVSTAYADEGATLKRWRPRARGRATRIRKRTCHITVVLSLLPEEQLVRRRARVAAEAAERRARRVAGTRRRRNAAADGQAIDAPAISGVTPSEEALPEEQAPVTTAPDTEAALAAAEETSGPGGMPEEAAEETAAEETTESGSAGDATAAADDEGES
jgi:large subunit ribosomal protein L22